MHVTRRSWVVLGLAALLLASVACTNDSLDDGSGADVVLQIENLGNDPVTATLDQTTGGCSIEVPSWGGSIANVALNETATTEFNNVQMQDVTISYEWLTPGLSTPTRTIGLGGATIPVNGSGPVDFEPISFDDVTLSLLGSTANLTLVFRGLTQDNEVVTVTALRQLFVEACN